jgi:WD40 repeat protein
VPAVAVAAQCIGSITWIQKQEIFLICRCVDALYLQVLWLAVGSGAAAAASGRSSSSIIRLCHAVQLPLLRTQWVLDAALLLLLPQAAAADTAAPSQQQQQQQQQLPSLQLFMLLMDNTVQVWHIQPGAAAAAAAGSGQLQCVLHASCSSRASLYSGALLLLPQHQHTAACGEAAEQLNGGNTDSKPDIKVWKPHGANDNQQQQQQQQLAGKRAASPVVWVAAGTAFGGILIWQLPWHTAAAAASAADCSVPASGTSGYASSSNTALVCPVSFRLLGHEGSIHRVVWGPAAATAAGDTACKAANHTGSSSNGSCGTALQLLGSCSDDRTCRLWQLHLQQHPAAATPQIATAAAQLSSSSSSSSSSTGRQCCQPVDLQPHVTLWGHTARVWDVAMLPVHGQQQQRYLSKPEAAGSSSSSSSSSSWLLVATASEDCSVRLWHGSTRRQLAQLQVRGRVCLGQSGLNLKPCMVSSSSHTPRAAQIIHSLGQTAAVMASLLSVFSL